MSTESPRRIMEDTAPPAATDASLVCEPTGGDRSNVAGPDRLASAIVGVEALDRHILRGPTVTRALEAWCQMYGIGRGSIRSRKLLTLVAAAAFPADLHPDEGAAVSFRLVELRRGREPLARAEIWYLPDRLPRDIRECLDVTDTPFARAIAPLQPVRQTLWRAAPAPQAIAANAVILEHRALILSGDGRRIAATHERFLHRLVSGIAA